MKTLRLSLILLALALVGSLYAQGRNELTLSLTDAQLKGLTWASEQSNAACLAANPKATCNETPDEYAQRIFAGVAQDYYRQLTGTFQSAVTAELKKAYDAADETKLDAVASALGVARPDKAK